VKIAGLAPATSTWSGCTNIAMRVGSQVGLFPEQNEAPASDLAPEGDQAAALLKTRSRRAR
jgi:hypothetical protein